MYKEWWEKEEEYERRYQSGQVATDLWKYIPEKVVEGIDWVTADSEGYWIYLAEGWTSYDGAEDCGTIHCHTIADLKEGIRTIRRKGR